MKGLLPALARWVSGKPRQALALLAVLTIVMGVSTRNVRLDNNFAALIGTSWPRPGSARSTGRRSARTTAC